MTQSPLVDRITTLAAPLAASLGVSLWGVEAALGGQSVVRIFAEGEEGITIEQCAELSRLVGLSLEVEDIISGPYVLEVSSPGLERVFFTEAQLARAVGSRVEITLFAALPAFPGRKKFRGVLTSAPATTSESGAFEAGTVGRVIPKTDTVGTGADTIGAPAGTVEIGISAGAAPAGVDTSKFTLTAEDIARPGEEAPSASFTFAEVRKAKLVHFAPESAAPAKAEGKTSGKAAAKTASEKKSEGRGKKTAKTAKEKIASAEPKAPLKAESIGEAE